MRIKYTTILLMILVALMIVVTGSVDNAAGSGHFVSYDASAAHLLSINRPFGAGGQMPAYYLPQNNIFIALAANAGGLGYNAPYVTRARNSQNENRDNILKLIVENPGLNSYDLSKKSGINIGTVRYHLMILSVNHLVVPYHDGEKQIRYFTNKGAYNKDQMKLISLFRREPMGKLIRALADSNGMANSGISAASGLSYSEVNRYLKELVAKGVVMKESLSERKSIYRIAPGFEKYIPGDLAVHRSLENL